jgi:hypothetical protein
MSNILERLTCFVQRVFKTTVEVFLEALKRSPNAQGYVSGSITELLLKRFLEERNFTVLRIREKWEGRKHAHHHGDFYIRQTPQAPWYVLESKGIKSNSEKWHKLYNADKLSDFLLVNRDKICWLDENQSAEEQIRIWIDTNLPKFRNEYSETLYDYEEIQKYVHNIPNSETIKSKRMMALSVNIREEISSMIEERLRYLMTQLRVLETHFVSQASEMSGRTQATPRKDEFNLIAVDLFLRCRGHKFLFANPNHLDSSAKDVNHLQQNYIIGFVFFADDGMEIISKSEEWNEDFMEVFNTLTSDDAINESEMQVDNRYANIEDNVGDYTHEE